MSRITATQPDGRTVEYRRHPYDPGILFFAGRVLKLDGMPHDERWYPCDDSMLLWLNHAAPEVLTRLWEEEPR